MKIMVLECDPNEQTAISKMLNGYDVIYETTVTKAINRLGLQHVDFALIDADFENTICDWQELTSFLNVLNIDYSIFSSNGKVGIRNGTKIVSIYDLPEEIPEEIPEKIPKERVTV